MCGLESLREKRRKAHLFLSRLSEEDLPHSVAQLDQLRLHEQLLKYRIFAGIQANDAGIPSEGWDAGVDHGNLLHLTLGRLPLVQSLDDAGALAEHLKSSFHSSSVFLCRNYRESHFFAAKHHKFVV